MHENQSFDTIGKYQKRRTTNEEFTTSRYH